MWDSAVSSRLGFKQEMILLGIALIALVAQVWGRSGGDVAQHLPCTWRELFNASLSVQVGVILLVETTSVFAISAKLEAIDLACPGRLVSSVGAAAWGSPLVHCGHCKAVLTGLGASTSRLGSEQAAIVVHLYLTTASLDCWRRFRTDPMAWSL